MQTANTTPFEIIAAPYELWVAPVGTAMPEVDVAPGVGWEKVGTSGDRNYTRDGVKALFSESSEKFRAAGSTGATKIFSIDEDLSFEVELADMTLEAYQHVLNYNAITTTAAGAGQPGTKEIGMTKGASRVQRAVLLRGPSPYMDGGVAQFECPVASPTGNAEPQYGPGKVATLKAKWEALEDPDAASEAFRFGRLKAQTAPAV